MVKRKERVLEDFLCGKGPDDKGRYLWEILSADDEWWEDTHDYIQWVFPTDRKSSYNRTAPTVSVPVRIKAPRLIESYARFRMFLRNADWEHPDNHNMRRITRVIRSLVLFGHTEHAQEFYEDLVCRFGNDPAFTESVGYWEKALEI